MKPEEKIQEAKAHLKETGVDGWLLYDFHRNNELAHFFLGISPETKVTRRFFYWIPVQGGPIKLVHAIETHLLDHWPGEKRVFLSWESLHEQLGQILKGTHRVAMEYSPKNAIPYVSKVDAGTVDLVRSLGPEVVSSGSFLPYFTAVISEAQGHSHIRAGQALERIAAHTWAWISESLRRNQIITEYDVQQEMIAQFKKEQLMTDGPPIVAVNAHSADPHFAPSKDKPTPVRKGDFVLIDLWGKEAKEGAVFADITRVAVAAKHPNQKQQEIFLLVRQAQRAATELIKQRFSQKRPVFGWEADDAARQVIRAAGYGEYFIHRTGHSIEVNLHGSGTHLDNLEMHDERPLLPGTCCSVEPGIYLPGEFGVRLEYDLYIHRNGEVEIVGGVQDQIVPLG